MAVRNIRIDGDELLRKKSREVDQINGRVLTLLDDMADTMYNTDTGIGLAAPQVGVLKRVVVIDIGDGLIELINPEVISRTGEQTYVEGCLSVPGIYGEVKRPMEVEVHAINRDGEEIEIKGEGMMAVVLCHEIDHLDGILFKDKVDKFISNEEVEEI